MNDSDPNDEFWETASNILVHASHLNEQGKGAKVSAALIYAAARYAVYTVASQTQSAEELCEEREEAVHYFREQFCRMFGENFDDYAENYTEYITGDE